MPVSVLVQIDLKSQLQVTMTIFHPKAEVCLLHDLFLRIQASILQTELRSCICMLASRGRHSSQGMRSTAGT